MRGRNGSRPRVLASDSTKLNRGYSFRSAWLMGTRCRAETSPALLPVLVDPFGFNVLHILSFLLEMFS